MTKEGTLSKPRERRATDLKRYRRLLRYAIADWQEWLRIAVITLLSSACGLWQLWPVKVLVDTVFGAEPIAEPIALGIHFLPGAGSPMGLVTWLVLSGLAIFLVTSALDVVLTRTWIVVGQQMVYRLAADL